MSLSARSHLLTDVGCRRQVNEDWCGAYEPVNPGLEEGYLWVVADGVGAYGTGEEASRAAGEAILQAYRASSNPDQVRRLQAAVEAGNRAVWERRRDYVRRGQSRPVMTTALVAVLAGDLGLLANVGDCRAYLLRGGRITQLTHDHTWVSEQVEQGLLTPEQARNHPRGHVITRSLGQHETVQMDLFEVVLQAGDRLVLCSDGLIRYLSDEEILRHAVGSPTQATRLMVDLANARGGEDNITVAVIELVGAPRASTPGPMPAVSLGTAFVSRASPQLLAEDEPLSDVDPPRVGFEPEPAAVPAGGPSRAEPKPSATHAAIDTSRLRAAESDHLALLIEIGQRISASLDLTETLAAVMDSVVEVTGGERGFIMLWDDEAGELVYSTGRNLSPSGRQAPEFSRNIVQSVFQSGEPIVIGDALADARFNQFESVVVRSLRSVLCTPLQVEGRRIGVVYVENRLGAEIFSETDLDLLSAFAGQAAVALQNARLHDQLRRQMAEIAVMRTNQENVLRSISSAIISLDAEGRILLLNRVAEELLGVRIEQALRRRLEELLPPSLHRSLSALVAEQGEQDGGPEEVQLDVRLPHRGRAIITVRVLPLADDASRRVGSVLVVEDITQQRLLAEAHQREAAEKERIKAVFGRFLAPSVFEQLMDNPASVHLGGTRCDVTVMFADMRGFTGLSEQHSPEEVVAILNRYLACATEVILACGGTLDKFLGDGVMAFFNAPLPQEDHVLAAARAAVTMQARLRELQGPGGSRVAFGIGINTGEGIVGNIGTAELMNYTIIGDVVNVAARLQGEARAGEVLLSEAAYRHIAGRVEAEELGSMHVKGRVQPVQIYKVIRLAQP
jgi:PAS domain S-box-containing protein